MGRKLYFNGDILTMEKELYAEAVLEEDGRILAVGKLEDWMKKDAKLIDLQGRTMMPAFIDPHSHFTGYATAMLQVSLDDASSFEEIREKIQDFIIQNKIKPGEWIQARGYDHNRLSEKKHPDRVLLDEAAPDNPLVISHQSGHMGVFNSRGLAGIGVDEDTECPPGGVIGTSGGRLTGYMEETAFVKYQQMLPMPSMDSLVNAYLKAQDKYASYGITTVQEGMMMEQMGGLYAYLLEKDILKLDVVAYADIRKPEKLVEEFASCFGKYNRHFKMGGYKIMLDGSPQGHTAWMKKPYLNGKNGEKGYPVYTDKELEDKIRMAYRQRRQIIVHCNGDAASEQFIRVYKKVAESEGRYDARPVIIHAQLMDEGQMEQAGRLSMIPSFFIAHIWYWGDIHIESFGKERADRISMVGTALKDGLIFTFHQDAPVINADMLETVWCAVNRITKNGVILGSEERIGVLDALKAVTVNAAYQYFEEDVKGSIRTGKYADFVILDKNPVKAEPMEIRDIAVLETIKEGKSIWKKA